MNMFNTGIKKLGGIALAALVVFIVFSGTLPNPSENSQPAAVQAALPAADRMEVLMDDCTTIRIDNASHMSHGTVYSLVLAADRSTQTGCPFEITKKGFFKTGDRIFVSDYYI